ncbi:hypothetical protein B0T17DRAFT_82901 [Bombardia bombarda]|uniref:Uncharacterized protein n=1 Tax=Bombardia bombarda TaxID=252184 RepID=A0AA39XM72_9PEZI|nr:hypothetical protein B0T17DRAFT_82901 [Bombardia bombarda]
MDMKCRSAIRLRIYSHFTFQGIRYLFGCLLKRTAMLNELVGMSMLFLAGGLGLMPLRCSACAPEGPWRPLLEPSCLKGEWNQRAACVTLGLSALCEWRMCRRLTRCSARH